MYNRSKIIDSSQLPQDRPKVYVLVVGEVKKLTEAAVLITRKMGTGELSYWIPKSQVRSVEAVEVGQQGLTVTEWFAKKQSVPYNSMKPSAAVVVNKYHD